MKPDVIGLIRDVRKPKNGRFRVQVYILLVCLLMAIFFWLLVRLSKEYYHTVNFGLRYTRVPENLLLTGHSDAKLTIKIKIQGFDIFSEEYLKKDNKILDISLRSIKVRQAKDGRLAGYLVTSSISGDIASQLNYPFEIYSISPDTLYFTFERRSIRKMVPLKPRAVQHLPTVPSGDSIILSRR